MCFRREILFYFNKSSWSSWLAPHIVSSYRTVCWPTEDHQREKEYVVEGPAWGKWQTSTVGDPGRSSGTAADLQWPQQSPQPECHWPWHTRNKLLLVIAPTCFGPALPAFGPQWAPGDVYLVPVRKPFLSGHILLCPAPKQGMEACECPELRGCLVLVPSACAGVLFPQSS